MMLCFLCECVVLRYGLLVDVSDVLLCCRVVFCRVVVFWCC